MGSRDGAACGRSARCGARPDGRRGRCAGPRSAATGRACPAGRGCHLEGALLLHRRFRGLGGQRSAWRWAPARRDGVGVATGGLGGRGGGGRLLWRRRRWGPGAVTDAEADGGGVAGPGGGRADGGGRPRAVAAGGAGPRDAGRAGGARGPRSRWRRSGVRGDGRRGRHLDLLRLLLLLLPGERQPGRGGVAAEEGDDQRHGVAGAERGEDPAEPAVASCCGGRSRRRRPDRRSRPPGRRLARVARRAGGRGRPAGR